jgi:hypothetical protein
MITARSQAYEHERIPVRELDISSVMYGTARKVERTAEQLVGATFFIDWASPEN